MMSPARFIRNIRQEAKKISWPTKQEISRTMIMVLIAVAIASVFFFIADKIFAYLMQEFLNQ